MSKKVEVVLGPAATGTRRAFDEQLRERLGLKQRHSRELPAETAREASTTLAKGSSYLRLLVAKCPSVPAANQASVERLREFFGSWFAWCDFMAHGTEVFDELVRRVSNFTVEARTAPCWRSTASATSGALSMAIQDVRYEFEPFPVQPQERLGPVPLVLEEHWSEAAQRELGPAPAGLNLDRLLRPMFSSAGNERAAEARERAAQHAEALRQAKWRWHRRHAELLASGKPTADALAQIAGSWRERYQKPLRAMRNEALAGCKNFLLREVAAAHQRNKSKVASDEAEPTSPEEVDVEKVLEARGLSDPQVRRARAVLAGLDSHSAGAFLTRQALEAIGLPPDTVYADQRGHTHPGDVRSGKGTRNRMQYRVGYLRDYVIQRWKPQVKQRAGRSASR